jgi:hypothetical protein
MRKIIPNLLAVLAVLNLVWLFVFNYRMPSFFTKIAGREEQSIEQEALSPSEEGEVQAPETSEEGAETGEAALQEAGQQETNQQTGQQETAAAQAPAEQTGGQAAGEAAEGAAENPAGTGDAATQAGEAEAQAGETISLEGQRTCRPADGNTPNIRSGPGSDYGVIRMAAYDEVMIVRGEAEGGWLPIQTQDGLEGYIYEGMLIIDEEAQ